MLRLLGCAALLLAMVAAGAEAETQRPPAALTAPCAAAGAKVDYGRLLQIPDALKSEIEAYRAAWRNACVKKKDVSLGALLALADAISKAFAALMDKSGLKETKYEELHALLQTAYPRFIP